MREEKKLIEEKGNKWREREIPSVRWHTKFLLFQAFKFKQREWFYFSHLFVPFQCSPTSLFPFIFRTQLYFLCRFAWLLRVIICSSSASCSNAKQVNIRADYTFANGFPFPSIFFSHTISRSTQSIYIRYVYRWWMRCCGMSAGGCRVLCFWMCVASRMEDDIQDRMSFCLAAALRM